MKNTLIALCLLCSTAVVPARAQLAETPAFDYGEELVYELRYSLYINIGVAELRMKIKPNPKRIGGQNHMHITAIGKTFSFYNSIFPVDDRYETYINDDDMLPTAFSRVVNEGDYSFDESVVFLQKRRQYKLEGEYKSMPFGTQDILSAIYYSRAIDYDNMEVGDSVMFKTYMEDSIYEVGLRYGGIEVIDTKKGKMRCHKVYPIVLADRVFNSDDAMVLWATADDNRVPVRIETAISVGAIRADLTGWSNLANPIEAVVED